MVILNIQAEDFKVFFGLIWGELDVDMIEVKIDATKKEAGCVVR